MRAVRDRRRARRRASRTPPTGSRTTSPSAGVADAFGDDRQLVAASAQMKPDADVLRRRLRGRRRAAGRGACSSTTGVENVVGALRRRARTASATRASTGSGPCCVAPACCRVACRWRYPLPDPPLADDVVRLRPWRGRRRAGAGGGVGRRGDPAVDGGAGRPVGGARPALDRGAERLRREPGRRRSTSSSRPPTTATTRARRGRPRHDGRRAVAGPRSAGGRRRRTAGRASPPGRSRLFAGWCRDELELSSCSPRSTPTTPRRSGSAEAAGVRLRLRR